MTIRAMTLEDEYQYKLLSRVCFMFAADEDYQEKLKKSEKEQKKQEEQTDHIKLGAFDDSGKLIAGLYVVPFMMYFDGNPQKMAGIQGVITAPEARNGGVMGKVMQECLTKIKQDGYIFSALYPFSYAYYRKFGYDVAHKTTNATIQMQDMEFYEFPTGEVRFWRKGDDLADIKAIYGKFAQKRNYAIVRTDKDWAKIMEEDPYIARKYTYVHYDTQNTPDAYIKFGVNDDDPNEDKKIVVDEMAWINPAALHSMFGFIAKLRPQFGEFTWNVPNELDLYLLFPEAWNLQISSESSMMFRIVDILPAIHAMQAPLGSGNVTIAVTDKNFPENTGTYSIAWQNGKIAAKKESPKPAAADMSTTIEALSQMLIGYSTPSMSNNRKDTTINNNLQALNALFPPKARYIWERF